MTHAYRPGKFGGGCMVQLSRFPCPYAEDDPIHLHPTGADTDAEIDRALREQQAQLEGVELQLSLDLPPTTDPERKGWNR